MVPCMDDKTETENQAKAGAMIVPVTLFEQNCTIIWCEATKKAVVIDPGGDVPRIQAAIKQTGVAVEKIWLTHGHIDHVGGCRGSNARRPCAARRSWRSRKRRRRSRGVRSRSQATRGAARGGSRGGNRRLVRGEFGVRFGRMFLHAFSTRFAHPVGEEPLAIVSALPDDCNLLVQALAARSHATAV